VISNALPTTDERLPQWRLTQTPPHSFLEAIVQFLSNSNETQALRLSNPYPFGSQLAAHRTTTNNTDLTKALRGFKGCMQGTLRGFDNVLDLTKMECDGSLHHVAEVSLLKFIQCDTLPPRGVMTGCKTKWPK